MTQTNLDKLYEEKNNLIIRIACLTDEVLKEQCAEQYEMLDQLIKKEESISAQQLELQQQQLATTMINDLYKKYLDDYVETDLITAINKTNNIDVSVLLKNARCRIGIDNSIDTNRRQLLIMANAIQKRFIIKDIEGMIVDIIPNIKTHHDDLIIFTNSFSRLNEQSSIIKPMILKK